LIFGHAWPSCPASLRRDPLKQARLGECRDDHRRVCSPQPWSDGCGGEGLDAGSPVPWPCCSTATSHATARPTHPWCFEAGVRAQRFLAALPASLGKFVSAHPHMGRSTIPGAFRQEVFGLNWISARLLRRRQPPHIWRDVFGAHPSKRSGCAGFSSTSGHQRAQRGAAR